MMRISKKYYRFFRNLNEEAVDLIAAITEGNTASGAATVNIWKIENFEALLILRRTAEDLSEFYNIPPPAGGVHFGSRECYWVVEERIEIPKISIISFLHEYRHHMQKYGKIHYRDKEDDARGWSISMFAYANPEKFDKAWRNNRIWYLPAYNPNWRQEVGL